MISVHISGWDLNISDEMDVKHDKNYVWSFASFNYEKDLERDERDLKPWSKLDQLLNGESNREALECGRKVVR